MLTSRILTPSPSFTQHYSILGVNVERGIGPIASISSQIVFEQLITAEDPIWGNLPHTLILQCTPISTHTASTLSGSISHNGYHHGGVSGEVGEPPGSIYILTLSYRRPLVLFIY